MDDRRPIFDSTEQAVNVLWFMFTRMAGLLTWTAIALLHTALLAVLLLVMWSTQTTPAEVAEGFRAMLQTWPAAALAAVGVSASALAAGYWWVLKHLHRALQAPLGAYLLPPAGQRIGP